jgi:phage recombination protein Bet
MSDLEIHQFDGAVTQFEPISGERRALLKKTIAKDLTDDEMDLFVAVCNRRRLDPFVKQIHAVKRRQWNTKLNDYEQVMIIQTGIDGFRLIAERTHERDGVEGPWWCGPDGEWRDVWLTGSWPAAAKVIVYRKGHARGYAGIAHWEEYVQTIKDKKGNWVPNHMWSTMPAGQLAKCADALAHRKAFPEELSGIYTDDEMGQADSGRLGGEMAPPAQPVGATLHVNSQGLPTGFVIPTLDLIKKAKTYRAAKELIQASTPEFQALLPRAIADVHGKDPHWFWENVTAVTDWRAALEYAVELHEQQQHETSEEDHSPRSSSDQMSPTAQVSKGKADQAVGDDSAGGEPADA